MFNIVYPKTRLRRNRKAEWSRSMVAEHRISTKDLILPLFVQEGENRADEIPYMPGILRYTSDLLLKQIEQAKDLGINSVILFPYISTELRTADAAEAYNENNLMCRSIKKIKSSISDIGIIADVALDPYTIHGHDGLMDKNGNVLNDETIEVLCKQALVLATAGCDVVAPSEMMDGRIGKIRQTLEETNFADTQIMAYSAKYASNLYTPFREAVGSKKLLGQADKKTYHMDYRNSKEAMSKIAMDIGEGADMIIIKPGMPYLDVIFHAFSRFDIPLIAYQVSGEYSMLKLGAKSGLFDETEAFLETLIAFKRAGARSIITYAAKQIAEYLKYV